MNMRIVAVVMVFLASGVARVSSKPTEAVERVNRLAEELSGGKHVALSPAAVFYNLLMLGELAEDELEQEIKDVTGSERWRDLQRQGGGTVGWMEFGSQWWIDQIDVPSEWGRRVTENFRTTITPVDFWSQQGIDESGVGGYFSDAEVRNADSVLVARARFRPAWLYAMSGAGEKDFHGEGGRKVERGYIQSHIIPLKVWSVEERKFSLDLQGGGTAYFSGGGADWSGEGVEMEGIVFLPEGAFSSTVDTRDFELLRNMSGAGARYGKLLDFGSAELTRWAVFSEIALQEGGAGVNAKVDRYPKPPVVITMDRPFFYKITGAHGEIVMQGRIDGSLTE